MDRPDLIDVEGYDSKAARAERLEEIDALVESWLDGRTKDAVVDAILDASVPCATVQTVEEIVDDPHLRERGMVNDLRNQGEGRAEIPVPGMPIKFAAVDDPEVTQAPLLGEHTEEVLREIAGYGPEELQRLRGPADGE
jgi:crotonobetainyl-CoA:carnitine CoA-transferase CaiB-like acyl-CoA transferase